MKAGNQRQLAQALGVTERRVRQLEDEGVVERIDGTRGQYDIPSSEKRYRVYASGDIELVIPEIEHASRTVDDLFEQMSAASMPEREKIAKRVGPAMMALHGWLNVSAAMQPPGQRELLRRYAALEIRQVLDHTLALLGRRLAA